MKHKVKFIFLEEDEKDLIVSFVVDDAAMEMKSLILLRTFFYEEMKDESERGVKVSLEGDHFEKEDFNILNSIIINENTIEIKAAFKEYTLDISRIEESELLEAVKLLKKQNYDNRFTIQVA